jgi:hypothetical protein
MDITTGITVIKYVTPKAFADGALGGTEPRTLGFEVKTGNSNFILNHSLATLAHLVTKP